MGFWGRPWARGVYYTPQPVVSFIVRSVDEVLRTEFGLVDGLASEDTWGDVRARYPSVALPKGATDATPFVCILDPATGTGTFLVTVIDAIFATLKARWEREGKDVAAEWRAWVPKYLLPRLNAFELMVASYAVAHLKIGLKLRELGYAPEAGERANVFLTNALEPEQHPTLDLALPSLTEEALAANAVKTSCRITCIVGNPPYSGVSENRHPWIEALIDAYRSIDGKPLGEYKVWLRDDYVKFVRLCEEFISRSKAGVSGLISNNSFLDGLTYRGMRAHILEVFPHVRVVNLHGNVALRETDESGGPDENVFDIGQGVGVSVLARTPAGTQRVEVADLLGLRERKYHGLVAGRLRYQDVIPRSPNYFFALRDDSCEQEYLTFESLRAAMPVGGLGFQSHRDAFVIAISRDELVARMRRYYDLTVPDETIRLEFGLSDYRRYVVARHRRETLFDERSVVRVSYRPFDTRWAYYARDIVQEWQIRYHGHLLEPGNIGFNLMRQTKSSEWRHAFVASAPTPAVFVEIKDGSSQFPLWLYDKYLGGSALIQDGTHPSPNFSSEFQAAWAGACHQLQEPSSLAGFIYSVLYCPSYRSRYASQLKIDFPRVPATPRAQVAALLIPLGRRLISLHLVEPEAFTDLYLPTFTGSPEVMKPTWSADSVSLGGGRFLPVPEEVWSFHIGGYQVCEKWLKDRKGRTLTAEDILHYRRIVAAIGETIRIMAEIDRVIDAHGGWPGAFASCAPSAHEAPGEGD